MTIAFLIYAISILDNLHALAGVFLASVVAFLMLMGFMYMSASVDDEHEKQKTILMWVRRVVVGTAIGGMVMVFVPSSKTAWLMIGGYAAQSAFESETGEKLKAIVNAKLDEILAEQLAPKKEKK